MTALSALLHALVPALAAPIPSTPPAAVDAAASEETAAKLRDLVAQTEALSAKVDEMATQLVPNLHRSPRLEVFHGYIGVFAVAFLVTLIATPFMRKIAIRYGIIDRPSVARKIHKMPVAYLGGAAVFLGIFSGILFAIAHPFHGLISGLPATFAGSEIPPKAILAVVAGMTVIMVCGLLDDVRGIDPRAKIAGMLFAAAALATQDVGVNVAKGVMMPVADALGIPFLDLSETEKTLGVVLNIPGTSGVVIDVVYWVGTAVIAIFVIGACNASNLIDGLDGLNSGTNAIAAGGLLFLALAMGVANDGPLDSLRIVLCLALLGGCLGFLPHNFNPATIFLGDAGSLMLGYLVIVIVLTLGDTGKTHLVLAGLIIYGIPIMDTTLAIVRRKISGRSITAADDQHLHHMLKRALGVKGAVFVLYGIGVAFAALGIGLSEGRGRVTYALTIIFAAFIGVTAFKVARRAHFEEQAKAMAASGRGKVERGESSAGPVVPSAAPVRTAAFAEDRGSTPPPLPTPVDKPVVSG